MKTLKIWDNGKFNKDVAKSALGEAFKSKPELKPVRIIQSLSALISK